MSYNSAQNQAWFARATLIRGPTHVTQTDVWVSRGDTLSLFKRRGDCLVVIGVGRGFQNPSDWVSATACARLSFCFGFSLGRLRRLGAPPPRELEAKKKDPREKQGAVGGRRVHVGKIKCRDQHRAERARDQRPSRAH